MTQTVEAVYDGAVLRPNTALAIKPNTRVRVTVEEMPQKRAPAPKSFLETAKALQLEGPPDWSTRF